MKCPRYQKRFYRAWVKPEDLYSAHLVLKETDLQIFTNRPLDIDYALKKIQRYRQQIEDYISRDKKFLVALKPLALELGASGIIREMGKAARLANVGPMAAVAGGLAEFLGRDLLKKGYREIIIENGGDIFLKTDKIRKVAIYSGRQKSWQGLKIKIKPEDSPLGICTSSGKMGHSLSFGAADAVTVLAKSAALSDAAATAAGNMVQQKKDLEKAINFVRQIKGVFAVVVILGDNLASWGKVELTR